jgi:hypothetical protein
MDLNNNKNNPINLINPTNPNSDNCTIETQIFPIFTKNINKSSNGITRKNSFIRKSNPKD